MYCVEFCRLVNTPSINLNGSCQSCLGRSVNIFSMPLSPGNSSQAVRKFQICFVSNAAQPITPSSGRLAGHHLTQRHHAKKISGKKNKPLGCVAAIRQLNNAKSAVIRALLKRVLSGRESNQSVISNKIVSQISKGCSGLLNTITNGVTPNEKNAAINRAHVNQDSFDVVRRMTTQLPMRAKTQATPWCARGPGCWHHHKLCYQANAWGTR